jgi:ribosome-binding protein aMBF1 (putative translation factor)
MAKDFLDELVDARTARNPRFPDLVAEAERRRELARHLANRRQARGLTQTVVAARMQSAASVVSKLESGADVKLSTLQRYCAAIEAPLSFKLEARRYPDRDRNDDLPREVVLLMSQTHVRSTTT